MSTTELTVNFVHPSTHGVVTVNVDSTMKGDEAIAELIASEFIQANRDGYKLLNKRTNTELDSFKSLVENGVLNNDALKVVPQTDAGHFNVLKQKI